MAVVDLLTMFLSYFCLNLDKKINLFSEEKFIDLAILVFLDKQKVSDKIHNLNS